RRSLTPAQTSATRGKADSPLTSPHSARDPNRDRHSSTRSSSDLNLGKDEIRSEGCRSSVTAPAHLLGRLARGIARIAFSLLLCLQGRRAFGFLGREANLGFLGFTRSLPGKFRIACNLRGQLCRLRFPGGFALCQPDLASCVNGGAFRAMLFLRGIL